MYLLLLNIHICTLQKVYIFLFGYCLIKNDNVLFTDPSTGANIFNYLYHLIDLLDVMFEIIICI